LNLTKQFHSEPLKTLLRTKPWCLAYQVIQQSDENKQRIFQIAKPSEIYLDDDHQSAIDIKPLCAPDEPELIHLYQTFGSKWLSENVQRTLIHKGRICVFTTILIDGQTEYHLLWIGNHFSFSYLKIKVVYRIQYISLI
jgi:hypothetical protein